MKSNTNSWMWEISNSTLQKLEPVSESCPPFFRFFVLSCVSKSNKFSGPNVVVFLHGFPEIWYSWRHQMLALAGAGFRAIAPDYRGYGLSDKPSEPEKTTFTHLLDDLLAILDALSLSKVHYSFLYTFHNR